MESFIKEYKTDVLIIGGNLEGCISALECRKMGKKVLLVENSGSLGGAASNGLYVHFPVRELNVMDEREAKYEQLLMEQEEYPCTRNGVLIYDQSLKVVLQRLLNQAGVKTLTHIYPAKAQTAGDKIVGFRLCCKTGYLDVSADVIIDATDKMDAAGAAGLQAVPSKKKVKMAVRCNQVSGTAIRAAASNIAEGDGYLVGEMALPVMKKIGVLELSAKQLKVFHNEDCRELILYGLTAQMDEINVFSLSQARTELRIFAYELRDLLRKEWEGFNSINIIQTAPGMDCYGLRTYPENPYANLILLNNQVTDYSNIQAVRLGIQAGAVCSDLFQTS